MRLRLAGFPVRIHPSFLLIAALLGAGGGGDLSLVVAWVVIAGVSILLHELGHAVAFRRFGVGSRIELHAMGGVTIPVSGSGLAPGQQVAVSAAGPLTGLAVGLVVLAGVRLAGYQPDTQLGGGIVRDILFANIAWSLVNLLPVLPLDGGQLLAAVLRIVTRGGGEIATQVISLVTVVGVGVLAVGHGYALGAALLAWFWFIGARDLAARRRPRPARVAAPADRDQAMRVALAGYAAAPGDASGARLVLAYAAAGRVEEALSLVEGPQSAHLGPLSREALVVALQAAGGRAEAPGPGPARPGAPGEVVSSPPHPGDGSPRGG